MNKISLILPCYFRPQLLKWGLYSLSKQKIDYDYEILVLNDGLPDETENVCEYYKKILNIKYYFVGQRNLKEIAWRVPGAVFNEGVQLAGGNVIILSSPEIFYLQENSINQLIKPLENQSKLLVIPEGKDDDKGDFLSHIEKNFPLIDLNYFDKLTQKLNTFLPFCMVMKKQDFLDINGFNMDFIEGYCFDDNDFVNRLIKNGCDYLKIPIKIVHLYHSRFYNKRIGLKNMKELYEKNKQLYKNKEK